METASKSDIHKCSVCSKNANLICKACKGTPDGVGGLVAVYYCGTVCQKAGWKEHKPSCRAAKDRRALHRAGEIAQHLYFIFQRNAWMWTIERVENIGNTWLVFDGQSHGKSIVVPFPCAVFPVARDQEAIMTYNSCNGAVAFIHMLFGDTLKDIYSEVDEVTVRVKNTQLQIVWCRSQMVDARKYAHTVLRVTLNNGEVYAVDITGAQSGWHGCTVMPWTSFSKNRVDIVKEVHNFGETARINHVEAQAAGVLRINIQHIIEQIELHLSHYLNQWQIETVSLKAMLRCSEEKFKPKQDSLLRFMEARMLEIRAFAMRTGFFDLFTGKPPKR